MPYGLGSGFDIEIDVTRSLDLQANTARVVILGLGRRARDAISGVVKKRVPWTNGERKLLEANGASTSPAVIAESLGRGYLRIVAGYDTRKGQVFEGWMRDPVHEFLNPGWRTTIDVGDGDEPLREGTISKAYKKGALLSDVVGDLVGAMGLVINTASLAKLNSLAQSAKSLTVFPKAFAMYGQAWPYLAQVMDLLGLKWSIQDGEFLMLEADATLPEEPILLTPGGNPAMIGSPRRREEDGLEVEAQLDHRLKPGRKVIVKSADVQGSWRLENVRHHGRPRTGNWRSTCVCTSLSPVPGVI